MILRLRVSVVGEDNIPLGRRRRRRYRRRRCRRHIVTQLGADATAAIKSSLRTACVRVCMTDCRNWVR